MPVVIERFFVYGSVLNVLIFLLRAGVTGKLMEVKGVYK